MAVKLNVKEGIYYMIDCICLCGGERREVRREGEREEEASSQARRCLGSKESLKGSSLDPLHLELQEVVSHPIGVLGTKLQPSEIAISNLT